MGLQSLMRHFSIRLRMLGAIGVVLALLGIVGGAGLWGMSRQSAISHEFVGHAFEETLTLSRLRVALADMSRHEKDMVIQYESPEQLSLANLQWEKARQEVDRQIAHMLQGEEDEDNVLLREMQQRLKDYVAAVEPVIGQIKAGGYDSATVANRMLARAHEQYAVLLGDMQKIEGVIMAEAAALQAEEQAVSEQTMLWFAVAVAVAALVVVPTTLANMQSICQPLNAAHKLAAAIAKGDLTQPVQTQGKDELTTLMYALGMMQASLARIVGEVRKSTERIGTSSVEIASGNQDLSNRTEQAAGSLQQAASSLEQINGMVRQSAEGARQASAMAVANAEVAARGGQVVNQVVTTMDDINQSSRKIGDIIGVIDGIAFQTNILALNAAVEAARAGEAGRGFAVVAGEVRNLARRSAEAAQEIKVLIGASVDKVEAGTQLVAEAGQTIGEIVTHAQKISAFIGEITTAANEQSQGIGQVNSAVGQLDQMTQQNAALVEESAAAAENLRDQARRLASVVATFQLQPR
jgi:methyl-accepting chemotaxis protein